MFIFGDRHVVRGEELPRASVAVAAGTRPVHEKDYAGAMRQCQYAWLELKDRLWHLVIDASPSAVKEWSRKWGNSDEALSELKEEGWTAWGPYPKGLQNPEEQLRYRLMRIDQ